MRITYWRDNYRKDLFTHEKTAEAFEHTIFEAAKRCGWKLYAYVIMSNHYHLAIETPESNPGVDWEGGSSLPLWSIKKEGDRLDGDPDIRQAEPLRRGAQNPKNQMVARFTDAGIRLSSRYAGRDWQGLISLKDSQPLEIRQAGSRIEYVHEGLVEYFHNRPEGMLQGWIVEQRTKPDGEVLRLDLSLDSLAAEPLEGREAGSSDLQFVNEAGEAVLSYKELKAWDANGVPLETSMQPTDAGLEILIADAGARYPITVDPLIASLEEKFGPEVTGSGAEGDNFGYSVSVDGDTALVGAHSNLDNGSSGSAYIFTRSGAQWSEQAKLSAGDGGVYDNFGYSVSMHGDTALVGSYRDNDNGAYSGSAYVFTRSGKTWSEQAKLIAGDGSFGDRFGYSVSVSGDTALIGAYEDDGLDAGGGVSEEQGSAYVFRLEIDYDQGSEGWQLANGFDPNVPNDESTLDSDGDGDLDILEMYIFRTPKRKGSPRRRSGHPTSGAPTDFDSDVMS